MVFKFCGMEIFHIQVWYARLETTPTRVKYEASKLKNQYPRADSADNPWSVTLIVILEIEKAITKNILGF